MCNNRKCKERMKNLSVLVILILVGAGLFIFSCSQNNSGNDDAADDDSGTDDDNQDEPYIVDTSNSDCKNNSKDNQPDDGIKFEYEDGILTVIHTNVEYNCCLDRVDVQMQLENFVIDLYETEVVSAPCDCLCHYDITTHIANLESGTYAVNIYVYGELSVSGEVEIP